MENKIIAFILGAIIPFSAFAGIEVFSPDLSCRSQFAMGMPVSYEKSFRGILTSIEKDPTTAPPEHLEEFDYITEVQMGLSKVRSVYQSIFKRMAIPESEADQILKRFDQADARQLQTFETNQNGIDNTFYFIRKDEKGAPVAVIRATLVKSNETRKLNCESHVTLSPGNRVELERAYNASGPYSDIISRELMEVMAKHFNKYFGSNEYTIYSLTNKVRARLYRQSYGFSSEEQGPLDDIIKYLVSTSGYSFFTRYVGHVQTAFNIAFSGNFDQNAAIELLVKFEQMPGMKDYIPNLVAQTAILMSQRKYQEALAISDHLSMVGNAQLNDDYKALLRARIAYNPLDNSGDPDVAIKIIDDYIKDHKLALGSDNQRALMLTVFKLKIFLASENFEKAKNILQDAQELLAVGLSKRREYFLKEWEFIEKSLNVRGAHAAFIRLSAAHLILDLGTHLDFISIGTLSPRLYDQMGLDAEVLRNLEQARRFNIISLWLKENLKKMNLPEI